MSKVPSLIALVLCLAAVRAEVTLERSAGKGESWETPGLWSDGQAPVADEVYVVGQELRSPEQAASFPGRELILNAGGVLSLKGANDATITVPLLSLNGGKVYQSGPGKVLALAGRIEVQEGSTLVVSGTGRTLKVTAVIEGKKPLFCDTSGGAADARVVFEQAESTFTGRTIARGGVTLVLGARAAAMGPVFVEDEARLGWTGNVTVRELFVRRQQVPPGDYTRESLAGKLGDAATALDSATSGTLTVSN